jgi:hypothetical protein
MIERAELTSRKKMRCVFHQGGLTNTRTGADCHFPATHGDVAGLSEIKLALNFAAAELRS